MRTSISTRSGRSLAAAATAARPVGSLAHHGDRRVAREHRAEPGPHQVVVVDEEHAHLGRGHAGASRAA